MSVDVSCQAAIAVVAVADVGWLLGRIIVRFTGYVAAAAGRQTFSHCLESISPAVCKPPVGGLHVRSRPTIHLVELQHLSPASLRVPSCPHDLMPSRPPALTPSCPHDLMPHIATGTPCVCIPMVVRMTSTVVSHSSLTTVSLSVNHISFFVMSVAVTV